MTIRFACESCGVPFVVDGSLAGRVARCKKCKHQMRIPETSRSDAPASSTFRLNRPEPIASHSPIQTGTQNKRPISWVDAVTSQVGLAPISRDQMPALRTATKRPPATPLDDSDSIGPYQLRSAPSLPAVERSKGRAAGAVTIGYRSLLGQVQHLFRWLNESAYLVSIPFIMLLLLGSLYRNPSLAALGATVVVLLNLGRIVAGLANLLVIPFRESPIQGVLFLIPPLTFLYLWQRWNKVRKPVQRILGPIVTIGLVILAYAFLPGLRSQGEDQAKTADSAITKRLESGAAELNRQVKAKLERLPDVNTQELGAQAKGVLESIQQTVEDRERGFSKPAAKKP